MEGNAKIIKLIARDENVHLGSTQYMITKVLPKEDPDFVKIAEECQEEVVQMFTDAVEQEKEWADYPFKDGLTDWPPTQNFYTITLNGFVVSE